MAEQAMAQNQNQDMDLIIEVSCGNPGCIAFLGGAYKISRSHTIDAIKKLRDNGILGADIYKLWNDCCQRITQFTLWVVEAAPIDDIKAHVKLGAPRGVAYTDDELRKYILKATMDYDQSEINQFLYPGAKRM